MKTSRTKTAPKNKTAARKSPNTKRQRRSFPSSSLPPLVQRDLGFRKFVEFPGIKGRVVEKIELFTMADYQSLTVYFQDGTGLAIIIDPCLLISSRFSDFSSGDERVVKRWPTVRTVTGNN